MDSGRMLWDKDITVYIKEREPPNGFQFAHQDFPSNYTLGLIFHQNQRSRSLSFIHYMISGDSTMASSNKSAYNKSLEKLDHKEQIRKLVNDAFEDTLALGVFRTEAERLGTMPVAKEVYQRLSVELRDVGNETKSLASSLEATSSIAKGRGLNLDEATGHARLTNILPLFVLRQASDEDNFKSIAKKHKEVFSIAVALLLQL